MKHSIRILCSSLLMAFILSACGGGSASAPPPPPAPTVPTGVSATGRDGNNLISWAALPNASGVTSYNVYWSATTGVTKATGTKIAFAVNPWAHTGLVNGSTFYYVVTAVSLSGEGAESAQVSAMPAAAVVVADPLYVDQWHLLNDGSLGGTPGEDINVAPVWATYKGTGIRIAVVDDGLEIAHEDLASNVAATGLSFSYENGGTDPTSGEHGTLVAGIAASRDLNGLGGRGVAPRANMVGYNLLQAYNLSNEADAATRGSPNVHINTNSWGPPDNLGTLGETNMTWRSAITTGLSSGRGGLGTIYTWAAGNGGGVVATTCPTGCDNSNYDGYANNRGVIAVAAVAHNGIKSSYSEQGANLWVSAYGGEYCNTRTITTTDRTGGAVGLNVTGTLGDYGDPASAYFAGNRNYTRCMNGTSAATPEVAGVVALMLEASPLLGWRDVRLILAQSARMNDAIDPGWTTSVTTPVYNFNHKYGFGVVDAQAAVTLASTWVNVGPELTFTTPLSSPTVAIPDFPAAGVSNTINVASSGIANIEFIEITFSALDHTHSGDLEITLTSPAGTISRLAELHACSPCTAHNGWVFGSARHLGEVANGVWTLTVTDLVTGNVGTFQSWRLKFYGR